MTPEEMLRDLHRRYERVRLRKTNEFYRIQVWAHHQDALPLVPHFGRSAAGLFVPSGCVPRGWRI